MKILEISDDSGFLGIANYHRYQSFLSTDWDFEMIKEKIIAEMNSLNLLFWGTGMESTWKVKIDNKPSEKEAFREEKGVIEVTDGKLYLTNYETLTMAAKYRKIKLPEKHQEHLSIELENGKYMVKFRQMVDPEIIHLESQNYGFEIVLMKIVNLPEIYVNNCKKIFWSNY